jgi:ParB family chromosome partitioning protein
MTKKQDKRKVLGRGLDALIPAAPTDTFSTGITELDIDRVSPNRYQPREHFDGDRLDELAQSIRENGIIQPIVVRPMGEEFQIVAGERRWRAAQRAGLRRVPAVINHVTDEKLLEIALVENIQRQDLTPVETAKALRLLLDEHGLTQERLAERVGMKRPSVTNYLRLLQLAPPVREALEEGRLDMGHARALGGLDDQAAQAELCKTVLQGGLSVRQVEKLVARAKGGGHEDPKKPEKRQDPNVAAAEKRLMGVLGARVNIVRSARGAGRIEIVFKTDEELDRLFQHLVDDEQVAAGEIQ